MFDQGNPTADLFGKIKPEIFTLKNNAGIEIRITNYGATVMSIRIPDREGIPDDIVLGFDSPGEYLEHAYLRDCPHFGGIIGRYANRIAGGRFSIGETEYRLATNNNGNALHGGIRGFDRRMWLGSSTQTAENMSIKLSYLSEHLEEGYPGNLLTEVVYSLNNRNEFSINIKASTDRTTVLNLTNHSYFNLSGARHTVEDHRLTLFSRQIIEAENMIPTGRLTDVAATVYDFSCGKPIGKDLQSLATGYDIGYVLHVKDHELVPAACLEHPGSGRKLEVFTNQPSVHLYSGHFIPHLRGHKACRYGPNMGIALETQHYPDSPNHSHFPSTELKPGEEFSRTTVFRFGIMDMQSATPEM